MAVTTETIRKLTLVASAPGFAETTAAVNNLATATGNLAVVTDTASKRQLSAESLYRRQTLDVVEGARQQDKLAKAIKIANDNLAQGNITQQAHAERISVLNQKYGEASVGAKAFAAATSGVSGQLLALSAGAGPVGVFLSALGPWGVAAAIGLGSVEKALNAASDAAHALAAKALELRQFSEATGLTTTQVQALRSEAGKFGVTSEEAQTAVQNFTARFEQLRLGSGELYKQMVRLNPAITDQMQRTTNASDALTLFGQALAQTSDIFERNALVKAATGRGGITAAAFLSGINVDELTGKFTLAGKALDDNLIKKLPLIDIEIAKTNARASQILSSMFAPAELAFEKFLANTRLSWAQWWAERQAQAQSLGEYLWSKITRRPIPAGKPGNEYPSASAFGVGLGEAATLSQPKTLEAQAAEAQKVVQVLGEMASVTQIVTAKQLELNIAQKEMAEGTRITNEQKDALVQLAREAANGVASIKASTDAAKVQAATVGMGVGAAAAYTAEQTKLNEAIRKGAPLNAADAAAVHKQAQELGGYTAAASTATAESNARFERELTGLTDLEAKIAAVQRGLHGDSWKNFMNDGLSATMRLTGAIDEMKKATASFASELVQGLVDGKSAVDAFTSSASSLGKTLTKSGIENIIKQPGNITGYVEAGVGLAAQLGAKLFGGKTDAQKQAEQAAQQQQIQAYQAQIQVQQEAADRAQQYADATKAAGAQTQSYEDQITNFTITANQKRAQEAARGNGAITQLEQELTAERLAIDKNYAADQLAQQQQAAADALAKQQEIINRQKGFQDRAFAATNDTSTLAGQLAAFDRDAQQQRADEMKAGGEAINDLEAALGAERLKIVNDYGKQIVEAQKTTFKQILDYVQGLTTGALSVLSPADKLASAQAAFAQQLAQAQAGDVTALQGITATAQTLLELARDFYGPSVNFGSLYSQVTESLTALAGGQLGGIVGNYAYGGMVGNGKFGIDSVLARYRGGGSIYLSGGEFVTQARSVTPSTLPILQNINRTGSANDNDTIANLTRQMQAVVGQLSMHARILTEGNDRTTQVVQRLDGLRADARQSTGSRNLRNAVSRKAS